ncbi:hypothetical protein CLIB1423_34S00298 [[Candida] railenensis]|uniref:Uncharacterized protein n=1 Tax=[Candida] railenensis TaxID=45579 RepID=A0A9P0QVV3_9ASCO|nr:hypothetical protein CLIB1423_34S00298 [[Candida] railenensis]
MNVTSNGYYSSNYLKNRERYGRRYYDDSESGSDWGTMMMNDEGDYSFNDHDEDYESHGEEPTKSQKITEIKPKSILKSSGSNNQPNSGVKQNARFTSDIEDSSISTVTERESSNIDSPVTHSTKSPVKSEVATPTPTVSDDPDYLVEGMTPAQLINQQNSSYSYYDNRRGYYQQPSPNRNPYYRTNSGGAGTYSGNIIGNGTYMAPPRKRKERKVINQFNPDDHYIKQQRRYDSSTYKPTMYRHKTFREVFDDENKLERQAEYNPMEFVFQAPTSEQKNEKNIRKTFKSLTGKKDYNDLDYYEQQERDRKLREEKIAAEERRERELSEKVYLNESEELELKQRRKKLKILKFGNMLKFGKKKVVPVSDVEGDVFSDGEGSIFVKNGDGSESLVGKHALKDTASTAELLVDGAGNERIVYSTDSVRPSNASVKSRRSEKTARSEKIHHVAPVNNIPIGANANPNFTWWWNYILSWIVYERAVEDEASIHDTKSYVGTTKSGKSSKSQKSSSTALVATPKTDIAQVDDTHEELSPWKKIKRIPKNTKTTWQALQQPADSRFIKGGWSAAVQAVERDQAEQEALQALGTDGHSVITYPRSTRTGITSYDYDPDTKDLVVETDGGPVQEELYYNPIHDHLGESPPTSYNSLSPAILSPEEETGPVAIISNIASTIKGIKIMKILFAPIDVIGETFPNLQTIVIMVELVIFVWILYELSLLVDALCMMVKAVCAPMIAVGKFMNKIM